MPSELDRLSRAMSFEIERLTQQAERLTEARLKAEVVSILDFDILNCTDLDGNLLPMSEWPEDARKALSGFKMDMPRATRQEAPTRRRMQDGTPIADGPGPLSGGAMRPYVSEARFIDRLRAVELGWKMLGKDIARSEIELQTQDPIAALIDRLQGTALRPLSELPADEKET